MRLALYDNLANNAYIQGKAFHRMGYPVDLLLSPLDPFAMSDPRWEDLDLELPSERLDASALPAADVPRWVRRGPRVAASGGPRGLAGAIRRAARAPTAVLAAHRRAGRYGGLFAANHSWVIEAMREYDCVLTFGLGPAVAALAGVPCVAQGYGGDMTIVPFADAEGGAAALAVAEAKLQRDGLAHAARIVAGDPDYWPYLDRLGHRHKTVFVPTLVDTAKYTDGEAPELRAELLGETARVLVLVPARQDWRWKGSDAMLRGFAQATRGRTDVTLVCAGWGADLARSQALARELGLEPRVRFLPHALSKTRLLRHYRAADIILDQFALGSYGTSALEAMSCERPLLIHLDPVRFAPFLDELPPVANCRTAEEIAGALAQLIDDPSERRALGARARRWVVAHHGDELVERQLELCRAAVG